LGNDSRQYKNLSERKSMSLWRKAAKTVVSLGRPRRRREDNIKMDLQEVGWGSGSR